MIEIENPYLDNRKDWNEIIGREKSSAAAWKMLGFLMAFITIITIGGIIYIAQLPDVVPFVFKEDASGGLTALGIPNTELRVDNRIIANQLAVFIEALRQVPTSTEMRKLAVHRVKMQANPKLFRNQLAAMLKDEYANVGASEQNIEIKTIFPISKNTWEIEWLEIKDGVQTGRYKAAINYSRSPLPLNNPKELIWNPIGLSIDDITVNQVIGG